MIADNCAGPSTGDARGRDEATGRLTPAPHDSGHALPATTPHRSEHGIAVGHAQALPVSDVVHTAQSLARALLGVNRRWTHTSGVAARAESVVEVVPEEYRPTLLAAAWLHDIGYAQALQDSGFHPLDGARYLRAHGWHHLIVGLVAHHSCARFVADIHGLSEAMNEFPRDEYRSGPLADALTYADQTINPQGDPIDVHSRLQGMLHRHGPDSANAQCHHLRAPAILAAVSTTLEAHDRVRGLPRKHRLRLPY